MVLPRTVPDAKPGAGSPNATISLPDSSVGGADGRAVAAGTATSAATARIGRKRFTRNPPVSLEPGEERKSTPQKARSLGALGRVKSTGQLGLCSFFVAEPNLFGESSETSR